MTLLCKTRGVDNILKGKTHIMTASTGGWKRKGFAEASSLTEAKGHIDFRFQNRDG